MILGTGLDVVEINRIKKIMDKYGLTFIKKILSQQEIVQIKNYPDLVSVTPQTIYHIASRFAAKEAAVKALGTGFSFGIGFHDICILSSPSGQPKLSFLNKAQDKATELGVISSCLSLSHEHNIAVAVVILEG